MSPETKVLTLLERWEEERLRGQELTTEVLCADCPELAGEMHRLIDELKRVSPLLSSTKTLPVAPAAMAAVPQIPGYVVLGELSRGGMGVVYHAHDKNLNRPVALKMILAGARAGAQERRRFRTEAEAVARLQHPGIVQIYDIGEHEGSPFLSLEFCAGGSLAARLNGQPLPPTPAAHMLKHLALAVQAAHQQGILHRDLKPANVLLTSGKRLTAEADDTGGATLPLAGCAAKITDFGLAKMLNDSAGPTLSGEILGTPSYMAPEQSQSQTTRVGPAADVYALGAILFEMLTGRPPFRGATVLETLDQVRSQEPVGPRRLQPKVPRDLETICLKCLQKQPGKRYATAQALADDLHRFLTGQPIEARPVGPLERSGRWCRRHPVAAVGAALAALILALVGWGSYEAHGTLKATALKERLLDANTKEVPNIVKDMAPYRRWLDPLLRDAYQEAEAKKDARKHLHASLALLPVDPSQVEYLYGRLLVGQPQEVIVIREELFAHKQDLTERLWKLLENPESDQDQRLRAALALATFSPNDKRWESAASDVATLVIQNAFVISQWTDAFRPVGKWLIPPLAEFLVDEKRSVSAKGLIATVYGTYAADSPGAYPRLEKQLAEQSEPDALADDKVVLVKRQASIGVALVVMGKGEEVWPLLKHQSDPTLRSFLIERLGPGGVAAKVLTSRLKEEKDVSVKRAILLSLGGFGLDRLSEAERQALIPLLGKLYRADPDAGIHSAAEWLLRKWGITERITSKMPWNNVHRWYVNGQGHTMMMAPAPDTFLMGLRPNELSKVEGHERHPVRIGRAFAIASKEVTVEQYHRFRPDYKVDKDYAPSADCPVNMVSWYDAAAYCNWLSEREGIPTDQWCYKPNQEKRYADGMTMARDYLRLKGYRLPTEAEWEYACRAGAETAFSFGEAAEVVGEYGWYSVNSFNKSHRVGWLKPNDYGLFDMHGNASEWTQSGYKEHVKSDGGKAIEDTENEKDIISLDPLQAWLRRNTTHRVLRGGSFFSPASDVGSAYPNSNVLTLRSNYVGFRVAQSLGAPVNDKLSQSSVPIHDRDSSADATGPAADYLYLPNDTEIVVFINLKQIFDSELVKAKKDAVEQGKMALARIWAGDNPALQYLKDAGFDVFRDLHGIVAAINGSETVTVSICEGTFNVAKWTATAEKIAKENPDVIKITKLGSQSIYEINHGGFFTLLNGMLVSATSKEDLTHTLGRLAGIEESNPKKKEFAVLLDAIDNKQSINFVATRVGLAKLVKGARDANSKAVVPWLQMIKGGLPNIQSLSGAIQIGKEVRFQFDIRAKDEASAKKMEQAGSGLLLLIKLQLSQQAKKDESYVPLVDAAKTLRFTNQGSNLLLCGTVSNEVVEKLMENSPR